MSIDNPAGYGKTEPGSIWLVSDKWLEDIFLVFGCNSATVIFNLDTQRIFLNIDRECNVWLLGVRSFFVQCITGIAEEIQECLAQL